MRIEAADRAGRERLLRYCARPPFALDRLRELDPERLLYRGTKPGPGANGLLLLTPLERLDRLAVLVPPPAPPPKPPTAELAHRRAVRYAWAQLLARSYEVLPLLCPLCATEMRVVAFITEPGTVRAILAHLGEPIHPPTIAPARGPPLWEMPDAGPREIDHAQPAPEYEFDQRIAW